MNGHVSDIKAWLKLKLIASTQLSFLPKLLLEMKVNGLEDTLLHVIVSFYPHRTRRPLNLEQSRFFLKYISHNHSESESLGGGGRKETRKKYDSTIPCTWGELSTA